jgi:glutaminase
MATAGLYETSGDWLVTAGVPAKSGWAAGSSR